MDFLGKLFENIEFKNGSATVWIKVIASVFGASLIIAFTIGQFRIKQMNKLDDIEKLATTSVDNTIRLEELMNQKFAQQNEKIDGIYMDGIKSFKEYNEFNKKQLQLIIKYGEDNKELLSEMIELNSDQKKNEIINNIKHHNLTEDTTISEDKTTISIMDNTTKLITYRGINYTKKDVDSLKNDNSINLLSIDDSNELNNKFNVSFNKNK